MRQRLRGVIAGTLCVLLAGCATRLEVDGFVVSQDAYDYDVSILSARASTELDCPHGSLSFELLDVHSPVGLNVPQLFAVSGCGGLAVYSRLFIPAGPAELTNAYEGEWQLESLQRTAGNEPAAGDGPAAAGAYGGPCYGNGTCNRGLQCVEGTCSIPLRPTGPSGDE